MSKNRSWFNEGRKKQRPEDDASQQNNNSPHLSDISEPAENSNSQDIAEIESTVRDLVLEVVNQENSQSSVPHPEDTSSTSAPPSTTVPTSSAAESASSSETISQLPTVPSENYIKEQAAIEAIIKEAQQAVRDQITSLALKNTISQPSDLANLGDSMPSRPKLTIERDVLEYSIPPSEPLPAKTKRARSHSHDKNSHSKHDEKPKSEDPDFATSPIPTHQKNESRNSPSAHKRSTRHSPEVHRSQHESNRPYKYRLVSQENSHNKHNHHSSNSNQQPMGTGRSYRPNSPVSHNNTYPSSSRHFPDNRTSHSSHQPPPSNRTLTSRDSRNNSPSQPRRFTTLLVRALPRPNLECMFCRSPSHYSCHCHTTLPRRTEIFYEQGRCLQCAKIHRGPCPPQPGQYGRPQCKKCGGGHHQLLCPLNFRNG